MRNNKLSKLIVSLFKAFKEPCDEDLLSLYINRLENHDVNVIEKRIFELIDTSKFFPRIGEILDYSTEDNKAKNRADEIEFLNRFWKIARSPYDYDKMDDDIYTIKKIIGFSRIEDCYEKDRPWIDKEYEHEYYCHAREPPPNSGDLPVPNGGGLNWCHLPVPKWGG